MEYYTKSGNLSKMGKEHNRYIENSISLFRKAIAAVQECEMMLCDYNLVNDKLTEYIIKLGERKLPLKKHLPGPMLYEMSSIPVKRNVLVVDENGNVVETAIEMRRVDETIYVGTKVCCIPKYRPDAYEIFVFYPQYNIGFSPGVFVSNTHVEDVLGFCKCNDFIAPEDLMKRLCLAANAHVETPIIYLELARRINQSVYEKCLYENERRKLK